MGELVEPRRDRELWGTPRRARSEVRSFDPSEATVDEVLRFAIEALRWRDAHLALRLARLAHARAPEDDLVRAVLVWAEVVRRAWWLRRPTDQQVAELAALADTSAFARGALIRALLWRKDVQGARWALQAAPPSFREAPSVLAAEALTRGAVGAVGASIDLLRQLRATWPPWGDLVNQEILIAAACRDLPAVEDAYVHRCLLLGRRPRRWLPSVWLRVRHGKLLGEALWALGVAAGWAGIVLPAVPLVVVPLVVEWYMTQRKPIAVLVDAFYALSWAVTAYVLLGFPPVLRVSAATLSAVLGCLGFLHLRRLVRRNAEALRTSPGRIDTREPG